LASVPGSATIARRALARVLSYINADGLADVELLVTELITHAVRHGQPGTIALKLMRARDRLRIEVTNPGRAFAAGKVVRRWRCGVTRSERMASKPAALARASSARATTQQQRSRLRQRRSMIG
jgi:anti-sigma regulatory factor (Ser/Thr protein kinase)